MTMANHTIIVDSIACVGHGICADLFPEWIRLDTWGYPIINSEAIPPELLVHAKWAVANCPALALHLRSQGPVEAAGPLPRGRRAVERMSALLRRRAKVGTPSGNGTREVGESRARPPREHADRPPAP
jgi:ferredoxin